MIEVMSYVGTVTLLRWWSWSRDDLQWQNSHTLNDRWKGNGSVIVHLWFVVYYFLNDAQHLASPLFILLHGLWVNISHLQLLMKVVLGSQDWFPGEQVKMELQLFYGMLGMNRWKEDMILLFSVLISCERWETFTLFHLWGGSQKPVILQKHRSAASLVWIVIRIVVMSAT